MSAFTFTFQDIDHPERTTSTTTEGLDERWALQAAVDQIQQGFGDVAWQLLTSEPVVDDNPEETTP